jgi:hypothetical protein
MNDNLAQWLRDFAAANSDSFESNQVQNLVHAANLIDDLLVRHTEEERIEADHNNAKFRTTDMEI